LLCGVGGDIIVQPNIANEEPSCKYIGG